MSSTEIQGDPEDGKAGGESGPEPAALESRSTGHAQQASPADSEPWGRPWETPAEPEESAWAVPWSDLMMVMFVLFLVLYVESQQIRSRPVPRAVALAAEQVLEQSRALIRKTHLENVQVVLQDDRSVRVSVPGPMFFDPGDARIKPGMTGFLNSLAEVIRDTGSHIQVAGHTDGTPIRTARFPSNWDLSAGRAAAVVDYLVEQGGIDPSRFTVVAYSMYRPAVPNDSPDSAALNRRVDVIFRRGPDSTSGAL